MSEFRAGKSGDAFRTELKFEQKYDEEEILGTPGAIVDWITKVVGSEMTPFHGTDCKSIHCHLRDGIILCKLINVLNTFAGKQTISFQKKVATPFVAMGNIENFNRAATDFGLPQTALFQTTDLWEGRKGMMLNVVNCLNQLGFVANSKGFNPKYEGPAPPKP